MRQNEFYENGYTIKRKLISSEEIEYLKTKLTENIQSESAHGARHLQYKIPAIHELAYSKSIKETIADYFDASPKLVRAIYFNKTENANWGVSWHQDKTIAVKEKVEFSGFVSWSVKQGVVHVQPPIEVMQNIVTLRLHLDAANEENGALKVLPKSHKLGILNKSQIEQIKANNNSVVCRVDAGDAVIMSTLILHSSLKAKTPSNRRVIHLEYSSFQLPGGLSWL
ncbi:MAG: phytanoyl-CoA dioxygenase family protein [Xenococcaceae cyanobacterium]